MQSLLFSWLTCAQICAQPAWLAGPRVLVSMMDYQQKIPWFSDWSSFLKVLTLSSIMGGGWPATSMSHFLGNEDVIWECPTLFSCYRHLNGTFKLTNVFLERWQRHLSYPLIQMPTVCLRAGWGTCVFYWDSTLMWVMRVRSPWHPPAHQQCFCCCCAWLEKTPYPQVPAHCKVPSRQHQKQNKSWQWWDCNNVMSYWAKCNSCIVLLKALSALLTLGMALCLLKNAVHSPMKGL